MADTETQTGITLEILPEDDLSMPEGLELIADECVEEPDGSITLEDFAFLKEGENYVVGEEMLKREKQAGDRLGLRTAKALLRRQDLIPVEWRGKKILVFTGAVARSRGGNRYVAYLGWDGDRWFLDWSWLDGFFSDCRSVRRSRK